MTHNSYELNLESSKLTYRQKRKLYRQGVKQIQKRYDDKFPCKFIDKIKDRFYYLRTWFEWKDFIKYDNNFNGDGCLFDLILYKLEIMKLGNELFSYVSDEEKNATIEEINTAIELGKKARDTDYMKESLEWSKPHIYEWIDIYEGENVFKKGKLLYSTTKKLSSENNTNWFHDRTEADEWCEKNGHKEYTDVTYSYCSDWDTKENELKYRKECKDNVKREQDDYDKFFLYISKNFRKWWY